MTAYLTLEEVLERLKGDVCELFLEEDSDFKEDVIYGYMTEVDNTQLGSFCSDGVLNAREKDELDSNSDAASLVLQEVQQYLFLAWNLSTIDN